MTVSRSVVSSTVEVCDNRPAVVTLKTFTTVPT